MIDLINEYAIIGGNFIKENAAFFVIALLLYCAYYLEKIRENTAVIKNILWKRHFGE